MTKTKVANELASSIDGHTPEYKWSRGKAQFSKEALREHTRRKTNLYRYVSDSRLMVCLTAPLLYLCLVP